MQTEKNPNFFSPDYFKHHTVNEDALAKIKHFQLQCLPAANDRIQIVPLTLNLIYRISNNGREK